MGTQFWWFYDVLTLCIVCVTLYTAVSRGMNKMILQWIGFMAAFGIGIGISGVLDDKVYTMLYQEKITSTVQNVLADWDMYEVLSDNYASFLEESEGGTEERPVSVTAQQLRDASSTENGEVPVWLTELMAKYAAPMLQTHMPAHSEDSLSVCMTSSTEMTNRFFHSMHEQAYDEAAAVIEAAWYRPSYLGLVRMALFLLLEFSMMIVTAIIVAVAGNLEEQMHIRRFNHLLGVPVGLIEGGIFLFTFGVLVRLMVTATDGQMLLFNPPTIAQTKLFHYLYTWITGVM